MCYETYAGCPSCSATCEDITISMTGYTDVTVSVDSDGDAMWDTAEYGDTDTDGSEENYYCRNCGDCDFEIDHDKIPEDCECDECAPGLGGRDPNEIVVLMRRTMHRFYPYEFDDTPPEIAALLARRSLRYLPIRAERANEVIAWAEENLSPDTIGVELEAPHPAHRALAIPEPEEIAA